MVTWTYDAALVLTATLAGELPNQAYLLDATQSPTQASGTTDGSGNLVLTITDIVTDPRGDDYNHFWASITKDLSPSPSLPIVAVGNFLVGVTDEWPDAAAAAWFWTLATDTIDVELETPVNFNWTLQVADPDGNYVHGAPVFVPPGPPWPTSDLICQVDLGSGPVIPPSGSVAWVSWSDGSSDYIWIARTTDEIINPTPPSGGPAPRPGCTTCGAGLAGTNFRRP